MPRYIKAEDIRPYKGFFEKVDNVPKFYDWVETLPTADVVERKKGKWIDEKINSYTSRTYCSECGNSAPFICVSGDHYGRNMHGEVKKTKFCPDCGADMREETDDDKIRMDK